MYYNNPYGYGQPMYQQARPMQPQQATPFQDVRFVTAEEARGFMVMPNASALLIDRQSKTATLKMADAMGQSTTQVYRFEPIESATPSVVTIEQFNALVERVNALQSAISGNTQGEVTNNAK